MCSSSAPSCFGAPKIAVNESASPVLGGGSAGGGGTSGGATGSAASGADWVATASGGALAQWGLGGCRGMLGQPRAKGQRTWEELRHHCEAGGEHARFENLVAGPGLKLGHLRAERIDLFRPGRVADVHHHHLAGGEFLGVMRPDPVLDKDTFEQSVSGTEVVAHESWPRRRESGARNRYATTGPMMYCSQRFINCSRSSRRAQCARRNAPVPLKAPSHFPTSFMQLPSVPSRRVVWEDGMHLTPQHFQAQRRYQEDQTSRTLNHLFPFAYGLSAVAVDTDALRNGSMSLVMLRGVLPDGTAVHTPGGDQLPPPISLKERFSPTRDTHVVHLAVPRWRSNQANVHDDSAEVVVLHDPAPILRYQAVEERLVDEATGADPLIVRFAARNLYFLLDEEVTDDVTTLPIARVRRDGRGQYLLDTEFIPTTLQIGASERLVDLLRRTVALLEMKGSAMAATLNQAPVGAVGGAAAYAGNELATRWLLHAVRSADAPLRHLLLTRSAHPEQLFLELSRLAGALATFAVGASPRTLPVYDHDAPTDGFAALEQRIRAQLESVISTRAVIISLQHTEDVMHSGVVSDSRCYLPGTRWFLAVRAELGRADLVDRVQRLSKTCARQYVLELVNRAWNGLPTTHIPIPPTGIAPKTDLTYFELTMTGACATSIAKTQEIGVYVPQAIPGAYVEVAVLLPE